MLINCAGQMLLAPFSSDQANETRTMVELNLLGSMMALVVLLDQDSKQASEEMDEDASISADEVAAVIACALARPRDVSLNEIPIRRPQGAVEHTRPCAPGRLPR